MFVSLRGVEKNLWNQAFKKTIDISSSFDKGYGTTNIFPIT